MPSCLTLSARRALLNKGGSKSFRHAFCEGNSIHFLGHWSDCALEVADHSFIRLMNCSLAPVSKTFPNPLLQLGFLAEWCLGTRYLVQLQHLAFPAYRLCTSEHVVRDLLVAKSVTATHGMVGQEATPCRTTLNVAPFNFWLRRPEHRLLEKSSRNIRS